MTRYGYARVSTKGQATKGNSLEDQVARLKEEGSQEIYQETFTGTKTDRPQFTKLLSQLKEGDILVVTKLDRFARSAGDAINTVKTLFEKGVRVHILNMGLVENTPNGRLIFNILSSFAEFERDMIIERTQEGKAIARQRDDFKEGRPKVHKKKEISYALKLLENHSYTEVVAMTKISKSTLIRAKRELAAKEVN